jgi:hypothetical protein
MLADSTKRMFWSFTVPKNSFRVDNSRFFVLLLIIRTNLKNVHNKNTNIL